MVNYVTLKDAEKQERALEKKAENLQDFGTLTSLGASAVWFAEGAMNKIIPKAVHAISLAAVSVGIGAVLYSFKVRRDAEKAGLKDTELLIARDAPPAEAKSWTERRAETSPAGAGR